MPRRVLVLSLRHEYPLSGEGRSRRSLEELLAELGWTVLEQDEVSEGLPWRPSWGRNARRIVRARGRLRRSSPDLVIVRLPCLAQWPLCHALIRGLGVPCVVVLESMAYSASDRPDLLREVRYEPALALGKRLINWSGWGGLLRTGPRWLVCASSAQAAQARARLPDSTRIVRIPNASNDLGGAAGPRAQASPLRVGYLGHAFAYKGVRELAEAGALLRSEGADVELVGAFSELGSRSLVARWERSGASALGRVDPEAFLSEIDVLALPLYADYGTQVYPNVLLEAMSAGVPVVTTRLPTLVELFGETNGAAFVSAPEPSAIASGIRSWLDDDRRAEASLRLRERYRERYHRDRVRVHWQRLLKEVRRPQGVAPGFRRGIVVPGKAGRRDRVAGYVPEAERSQGRRGPAKAGVISWGRLSGAEGSSEQRVKADYYQRPDVVQDYDRLRFGGPSGAWVQQEEERALEDLLARIPGSPPGAVAMDAPAGTGRFLPLLEQRFERVIAMDISRSMLARTQERAGRALSVQGDVFAIPLREQSVSLILCSRLLFHFRDPDAFLEELARCLVPGGHLLIDAYNWTPRRWIPGGQTWLGGGVHLHRSGEIERACRVAGLTLLASRSVFVLTPFLYAFMPLRAVTLVEWLGGLQDQRTKAYYLLQKPDSEAV